MVRKSDAILAADLREARLPHLAERAEAGEWNDFFGREAMPQQALIAVLKAEIKLANPARKRLVENIMAGKYDGTTEESEEWAASPDGVEAFRELAEGVDVTNMDEVVAVADLAGRAGAKNFEIGYLHDDVPIREAGWWASANYLGTKLMVQDQRSPAAAARAMAWRLLDGGTCKCRKLVTLFEGTPGCRWRLVGSRWESGCDAPSITVEKRGDVEALRKAVENP